MSDFLARNRMPFTWLDLESDPQVKLLASLDAVKLGNNKTGEVRTLRSAAVFSFIGAAARSDRLSEDIEKDDKPDGRAPEFRSPGVIGRLSSRGCALACKLLPISISCSRDSRGLTAMSDMDTEQSSDGDEEGFIVRRSTSCPETAR
ncbi:MAG: hypothetical protein AB7N70_18355 [Dehalococcoidia bacterium]